MSFSFVYVTRRFSLSKPPEITQVNRSTVQLTPRKDPFFVTTTAHVIPT